MFFSVTAFWNFFFLSFPRSAGCRAATSARCLKFNINTDRAILVIQYNGGSRASALNSGNGVRSAAICSAVQKANLKAGVNTEKDNDEKDPCYLVEHKATEKPFDIFPFKPRGTL